MLRKNIISEGTQPFCIDLTHPTLYIKTVFDRKARMFMILNVFVILILKKEVRSTPRLHFLMVLTVFCHVELEKS